MTTTSQLKTFSLKSVNFGGVNQEMFELREGGDLNQTLEMAVDINLAVESLCDRLNFSTNNNGDPVTCAELRALSHLSGTAAALLQSVRYGLKAAKEASHEKA